MQQPTLKENQMQQQTSTSTSFETPNTTTNFEKTPKVATNIGGDLLNLPTWRENKYNNQNEYTYSFYFDQILIKNQ